MAAIFLKNVFFIFFLYKWPKWVLKSPRNENERDSLKQQGVSVTSVGL